jgi:hypothetical protein
MLAGWTLLCEIIVWGQVTSKCANAGHLLPHARTGTRAPASRAEVNCHK